MFETFIHALDSLAVFVTVVGFALAIAMLSPYVLIMLGKLIAENVVPVLLLLFPDEEYEDSSTETVNSFRKHGALRELDQYIEDGLAWHDATMQRMKIQSQITNHDNKLFHTGPCGVDCDPTYYQLLPGLVTGPPHYP
jgi:hypothetical protein